MDKDLSISLESKVKMFIENSKGDYGRYKSWKHCYDYFQNEKNRNLVNIEMLSLHLSMYLASWGMYRGSSFLLQHDYMYNENAVRVLLDDKYKELWNINWWNLTDADKEKISRLMFGTKEGEGLFYELEHCYEDKSADSASDGDNIATETLVTKILLGTMGCVPAYDRFLKDGIGYLKERKDGNGILGDFKNLNKTFNNAPYKKLLEIITSQSFIDICKDKYGKDYPPMKVIDMFLWETGFELGVLEYINSDSKKDEKKYPKRIEYYKEYFSKECEKDKMQKEILEILKKTPNKSKDNK